VRAAALGARQSRPKDCISDASHSIGFGKPAASLPSLYQLVQIRRADNLSAKTLAQSGLIAKQTSIGPHRCSKIGDNLFDEFLFLRIQVHSSTLLRAGRDQRQSVVKNRLRGSRPKDQPLQQRIRRQPVGAVHSSAGCLARRVKPRQTGAAAQVRLDAAHQIMRRWPHRNNIPRQVERVLRQKRADAGKALVNVEAVQVPHIEMHQPRLAGLRAEAFERNSPRHYIAGSQFQLRMIALHEAFAAVVAQVRALPAQRLGKQEPRDARQR